MSLQGASKLAVTLCIGLALMGCQSVREATGAAKVAPDEFTVLTKAPLVIPPDYNLRPPQPGAASRNELDPDDQGRAALFPQNAAAAAAALGAAYSDGEKLLLAKTNALSIDPNIRRAITSDVGQDDQGAAFSQRVLYEGASAPPPAPAANAAAPAPAAPAVAPAPAVTAPVATAPLPSAAPRTP